LLEAGRVGGPVVFYDLAESFTPYFTEVVIPGFTAATGIEVQYDQVNGEQTVQQLVAAQEAGQPLAVDIMWYPDGQARLGTETGIIANLPLSEILPATAEIDPVAATISRGYVHGGTILPWHRNQTSIGYDTRVVSPEDAPDSIPELLAFAEANPGKVAITNPSRGGSEQEFLESAILAMTSAECQVPLYDFSTGPEVAAEWAAGPCLDPVMAYFTALSPNVERTNGNTDSLTLLANGVVVVATVWEDQVFDFIGRGPSAAYRAADPAAGKPGRRRRRDDDPVGHAQPGWRAAVRRLPDVGRGPDRQAGRHRFAHRAAGPRPWRPVRGCCGASGAARPGGRTQPQADRGLGVLRGDRSFRRRNPAWAGVPCQCFSSVPGRGVGTIAMTGGLTTDGRP